MPARALRIKLINQTVTIIIHAVTALCLTIIEFASVIRAGTAEVGREIDEAITIIIDTVAASRSGRHWMI
jgi:hypothetical protein